LAFFLVCRGVATV